MRSASIDLILATLPALLGVSARAASWEAPQAGECIREGIRQYSAIVTGSKPASQSWEDACRSNPLPLIQQAFQAYNCGWRWGRVWGDFDVPDSSCSPSLYFLAPKRDACIPHAQTHPGEREYSAIIAGTGFITDWVAACQRTALNIDGTNYPSRDCGHQADTRVWGKFTVPDASCATRLSFQPPQAGGCLPNHALDAPGLRRYAAIIDGSNYSGQWVEACQQTPHEISGAARYASNCHRETDGRIWGEFDVPDSSCRPQLLFEPPRKGPCLRLNTRQYAAIISGTNYAGEWTDACRHTAILIEGKERLAEHCAPQSDGRVWGNFAVEDEGSCAQPFWFVQPATAGACDELGGLREYTALLDGADFVGAQEWRTYACPHSTALIGGAQRRPRNCVLRSGDRVWGTFVVPDSTCPSVAEPPVPAQTTQPGPGNLKPFPPDGEGLPALSIVTVNMLGFTGTPTGMEGRPGAPKSWMTRYRRLAENIEASGPPPDIISFTETAGWEWAASPPTRNGDYAAHDYFIDLMARKTGVEYRIAYMVGGESWHGGIGSSNKGSFSGDTVLYNPKTIINRNPEMARLSNRLYRHDTTLTPLAHLRRSLPYCNPPDQVLRPIETLIDGEWRPEKCAQATPTGPAWVSAIYMGVNISLGRFAFVREPKFDFDLFTTHAPDVHDPPYQRADWAAFVSAMTTPPMRTTRPIVQTMIVGDLNSAGPQDLPGNPQAMIGGKLTGFRYEFETFNIDVMAALSGSAPGADQPLFMLKGNPTWLPVGADPCRGRPDEAEFAFSDHCGIRIDFYQQLAESGIATKPRVRQRPSQKQPR